MAEGAGVRSGIYLRPDRRKLIAPNHRICISPLVGGGIFVKNEIPVAVGIAACGDSVVPLRIQPSAVPGKRIKLNFRQGNIVDVSGRVKIGYCRVAYVAVVRVGDACIPHVFLVGADSDGGVVQIILQVLRRGNIAGVVKIPVAGIACLGTGSVDVAVCAANIHPPAGVIGTVAGLAFADVPVNFAFYKSPVKIGGAYCPETVLMRVGVALEAGYLTAAPAKIRSVARLALLFSRLQNGLPVEAGGGGIVPGREVRIIVAVVARNTGVPTLVIRPVAYLAGIVPGRFCRYAVKSGRSGIAPLGQVGVEVTIQTGHPGASAGKVRPVAHLATLLA